MAILPSEAGEERRVSQVESVMLIGKPLINIPETSNPVNLFTILQILTIYIETYTDTNSQTRKLTLFTGDKIWSLLLAHIERIVAEFSADALDWQS